MGSNKETELNAVKKAYILFILGHGRSGTTLLQSILNSHPNIVAPPEYEFMLFFYARFGKIKKLKQADILEFIDALFTDHPHFSVWLLDKETLKEKLLESAVNKDYETLCKILMSLTKDNKMEIKLVSDKNSINSLFVKKLNRIFPDAKFIHMIRDPRDSVYGHIKRLYSKNPFFLSRRWLRYNIVIEHFKKKFPEKVFTIKYEDMVKDMDGTLTSLSYFLGVDPIYFRKDNLVPEGFQSSDKNKYLENLPGDQRNAIIDKIKLTHENLSAPVNVTNIEKWKREMNPKDIAITELITASYAKKYGYKIEHEKKNNFTVSTYKLLRSLLIFNCWELFTRWRYSNYRYNTKYKAKTIRKVMDKMIQ